MSQIQLTLLGTFAAYWQGQPVTNFPTDKVRALFAYLALEGERPLRRETLATLLWSNYPDDIARRNLRQNLHRLNQLLDALEPGFSERLLHVTRQTLQLNPAWLVLDVHELQTALTAVEKHPHRHLRSCATCLKTLTQAARLVQGDLLAGFTLPDAPLFDEWLAVQRERLHYQSLQLLYTLAEINMQQGHYDRAYQYAARQIQMEAWREEAHRQMMLALVRQGRRSEALAQYASCAQILESELGLSPAAETITLYRQIVSESVTAATGTPPSRLHHFPTYFTPFIGRVVECAQIAQAFQDPTCRLLSLIAPGGMGKTRLALHAVQHTLHQEQKLLEQLFPDGAYFVPLAETTTEQQFLSALGQALGVPPSPAGNAAVQIGDYLRDKNTLLLLDNLEQLLPTAVPTLLLTLLQNTPGLHLLVTSREPLGVQAERPLRLQGLSYPSPEQLAAGSMAPQQYAAMQLFIQAARRAQPDFPVNEVTLPAVARICQLTGGLPLALEIAAAWVRLLDSPQIAAQISQSIDFLEATWSDVPARHRSIRALFIQSWAYLGAAEQRALAQTAVFSGTFSVEAAQAVTQTTLPTLLRLLDKSLLQRAEHGRYALHELVHHFAVKQLATQPNLAQTSRAAHSHYYLTLVQGYGAALHGPQAPQVIQQLHLEQANLVQAWQTAVATQQWPLLQSSLESIADYHILTGQLAEMIALLINALETGKTAVPPTLAPYFRLHLARLMLEQGKPPDAAALLAQIEASHDPALQVRLAEEYGRLHELQGSYEQALASLQAALTHYAQTGSQIRQARTIGATGNVYWRLANYTEALSHFRRALAIATNLGDQAHQAVLLSNIGIVYVDLSDYDQALHYYEQALAIDTALGNRAHIARHTHNIARIYRLQEQYIPAIDYFNQALHTAEALGLRRGVSLCLTNMGIVYREMGQYEQAELCYQRALSLSQELGLQEGVTNNLGNLGNLHRQTGRFATAQYYFTQALQLSRAIGFREAAARQVGNLGELYKDQQAWAQALPLFAQAIAELRAMGERYNLTALLILQAETQLEMDHLEGVAELLNEGIQLARDARRAQVIFQGELLQARLAWRRGRHKEALQAAEALLATTRQPPEQAALYDLLWQITGETAHQEQACVLYEALYGRTSTPHYQRRLVALRSVYE